MAAILAKTNFNNDTLTGTVGADGFIGPLQGSAIQSASLLSAATTTGVTAAAGGGQTNATAITTPIATVDTVATAADSVKLPAPTYAGQMVILVNSTANSMQVFGSGTDTINGVATATGVAQAAGKTAMYIASTTGTAAKWWRNLSA